MTAAYRRTLALGPTTIALREYRPTGPALASIVIGGAMGAQQDYYAPYAQWLASQGYRVFSFDYRGQGDSVPNTPGQTLRGFSANLSDWALDYEAVAALARSEMPALPLYLVGHSLGAQLPGLFQQPQQIDGLLSIAAGSGYWRDNAPRLRGKALYFWYFLVPMVTRVCGYFPGKRLRKVGDLPAGVIRQWRRWCLNPRYSVGAEGESAEKRYAQVQFPVLAWSFSDDELMTLRGTRTLVGFYAQAPSRVDTVQPADAGVRRIGHFGFFRETFIGTLWPRTTEALRELGGMALVRADEKAMAPS